MRLKWEIDNHTIKAQIESWNDSVILTKNNKDMSINANQVINQIIEEEANSQYGWSKTNKQWESKAYCLRNRNALTRLNVLMDSLQTSPWIVDEHMCSHQLLAGVYVVATRKACSC